MPPPDVVTNLATPVVGPSPAADPPIPPLNPAPIPLHIPPDLWDLVRARVYLLIRLAPHFLARPKLTLDPSAPDDLHAQFAARDHLLPRILQVGASMAIGEPLYITLQLAGQPPEALFGLAFYALAVERLHDQAQAQRQTLQDEYHQLKPKTDRALQLAHTIEQLDWLTTAAQRELQSIEPDLIQVFWDTYEQAAVILSLRQASPEATKHLRAFLRYGMIGTSPWWTPPELCQHLLKQVATARQSLDSSPAATPILYADEYLDLVAEGLLTPAPDEELELNSRGSPRWRQDRAWRRLIACTVRHGAVDQSLQELGRDIQKLRSEMAATESACAALSHTAPDYTSRHAALHEQLQSHRVILARKAKACELLGRKTLPDLQQRIDSANEQLTTVGGNPKPDDLARREARQIRRVTAMCAKFKESFLPFTLRRDYHPDNASTTTSLQQELAKLEQLDPAIFRETLIASSNPEHRTDIRYGPYVLLTPGPGYLSCSWNPRDTVEFGRLVFPGYPPRPGLLPGMVIAACSDFRWDTSKQSAGIDLLSSDTLVATYSKIRWDYRDRSRDARQAAGIYTEESDRKNWRRHYALYLSSVPDAGRKLFHKCPAIYDAVIKYIGLPTGLERLRK